MTHLSPDPSDPATLAAAIAAGERVAVARGLNLLDDQRPEAQAKAAGLLAALPEERLVAGGHLIGLTGPPGVGKSTLSAALIRHWRGEGLRVGVLAVDPSSPFSGGAVLGDRLRMVGAEDAGVFVRSLADRGSFGGVSAEAWPMSQILLAAYDRVLIETVGVGQREIDIADLADSIVFVAQPYSGDAIQVIKAGILEVPDILVVNKADLGPGARRTLADLSSAIRPAEEADGWTLTALATSAAAGSGVAELAGAIDDHLAWLSRSGRLAARRRNAPLRWLISRLVERFGRHGIDRLSGEAAIAARLGASPVAAFALLGELDHRLRQP